MNILRCFGLLFFGLIAIGLVLSFFIPMLPQPDELSVTMRVVIFMPLLLYLAAEMGWMLLEAVGMIKRGGRVESSMSDDPSDKNPD